MPFLTTRDIPHRTTMKLSSFVACLIASTAIGAFPARTSTALPHQAGAVLKCSSSVSQYLLDHQLDAKVVTSLQITPTMIDPESGGAHRVVSFFAFTTVRDEPEYSYFHETRIFPEAGSEAVRATVQFEVNGESTEFNVSYQPGPQRTWGDVENMEHVAISASRIEAR